MSKTYPKWINPNGQHNMMFLIGNGFDLRILKALGFPRSTSYEAFYRFLEYSQTYGDPYGMNNNIIFNEIKKNQLFYQEIDEINNVLGADLKEKDSNDNAVKLGKECEKIKDLSKKGRNPDVNWSDFEQVIGELVQDDEGNLSKARDGIQKAFVAFLQDVISNELLVKLNDYAQQKVASPKDTVLKIEPQEYGRAEWSLSRFLGDLNDEDRERLRKCKTIPGQIINHAVMNYLFVNLNYTELLENFIYLDSSQFSPQPYKISDNFFLFDSDPHIREKYKFANWNGSPSTNDQLDYMSTCKYYAEVIHPHGIVTVPRSMLFGISDYDKPDSNDTKLHKSIFSKPYLAQDAFKYEDYFNDTELFVMFGISLGDSDKWWWTRILKKLREDSQAALIVYWFDHALPTQHRCSARDEHARKEVLSKLAQYSAGSSLSEDIKSRIAVIGFNDETPIALFSTVKDIHG